ncbi:hypothetical protein BDY21DRAFT_284201 [Lineolata rhizophorae]|uniref:Rhodopsin domain-containing protein n=1 Tax=Lineolata rhizophorae TaxID=578093 RepID=A0A6A6P4R5_9PEZI|nr:hypothetical protein BDY21DRAFT_284201 [Lineolata rhizophorae]
MEHILRLRQESGGSSTATASAPVATPTYSEEYMNFNNKGEIIGITSAFTSIAIVCVLLRVYVRAFTLRVFGGDDYLIVAAMVLGIGTLACFVAETHYGLGMHTAAIPLDNMEPFSKVVYVHSLFVMVSVSCVKISIAVFLLRLAQRTRYRNFLWGMIVFLIAFTISCAGTLIFQCVPVEAAWDFTLRPPTGDAKCFSNETFRNIGLFNSSVNILTDFLFASLPVPLIWKLQLNTRTKLSLIGVLSLGFFASGAAIVKAVKQWNVLEDPDYTVHDSFMVWNDIEMNIGIIAACLPAIKPLFAWFLETARNITTGSGLRSREYHKGASSLGYIKHTAKDQSVVMDSLPSRNAPYNVNVTSGASSPDGTTDDRVWIAEESKKSNESIEQLTKNNGIMKTREVRIA